MVSIAGLRISVVGTTGSGKSTFARSLAAALGIACVEEDVLHWGPAWRPVSEADPGAFMRRIAEATTAESWVVDGNYAEVRDLVWRRATHLIWLDYSRPIIMCRVVRRSLDRSWRRTILWSGNRETWRGWAHPDHPVWWAWRSWARRRRDIERLLRQREYAHLTVLRLRHPRDAADALTRLAGGATP
jgi:adenylate kinase family enzyme